MKMKIDKLKEVVTKIYDKVLQERKLQEDVANVSNIGGASFQSGQGEQYASPKAFSKGKRMTIRKSFLKELIQKEIKNIKK